MSRKKCKWLLLGSWMASNSAECSCRCARQKQARQAKEAQAPEVRSAAGRQVDGHVVTLKNSFPASHATEWKGVNSLLQQCLDAVVH